jgi:hypothetical protein
MSACARLETRQLALIMRSVTAPIAVHFDGSWMLTGEDNNFNPNIVSADKLCKM